MRSHAALRAGAAGLLALAFAAPAAADWKTVDDEDWCREGGGKWSSRRYCEIRETEIPAGRDVITVDGHRNGGIEVKGWDEDKILIRAKVTVWEDDDEDAREMVEDIRIDTDDVIRADGPGSRDGRGWSVDYRILVPFNSDLDLESRNGGLSVVDVSGTIDLETTNGGISLVNLNGEVTGLTTNGGVSVVLNGDGWDGEGLDVESRNGGISIEVPHDYSADLMAGTKNGGIRSDLRVRRQGYTGGTVRATLGEGGPLLRVMTRNGGIRIEET
ncbi:MAG TPA: DUF4097 family beta strand repeat-containing protein [bacterium]|nr:DUF4097 family beta strand repeat-containing protein [bacterium]